MRVMEQSLTLTTLEVAREELLLIKNVLYEAYVELGEWEFTKRIGLPPEEALALLKSINNVIKTTI
jgi:hypothetical protein